MGDTTLNVEVDELDFIIVGAGLSGIGIAATLQRERPGTRFVMLEARDAIGGTWDLFKYPGIRSDSDLYTFAYDFKPWTETSHRTRFGHSQLPARNRGRVRPRSHDPVQPQGHPRGMDK